MWQVPFDGQAYTDYQKEQNGAFWMAACENNGVLSVGEGTVSERVYMFFVKGEKLKGRTVTATDSVGWMCKLKLERTSTEDPLVEECP